VRSDLPDRVRDAIAAATVPSLVFDLVRIEANARAIAEAARGITTLFAMKSFAHEALHTICTRYFDGFDCASPAEVAAAGAAKIISIADPTGRARDADSQRLIVACETIDQIEAAPERAEIAIRVSMSITNRDPAIGAVHDGDRRRSRFGVETREAISAMRAAAGTRRVGLHVHHGPVAATSSERFLATARAALALADFEPAFLDLGGAWHAVADLPRTLREIRDAIPNIELIIEPGRVVADGAGFACGRVTSTRALGDRTLAVVDLSRICHLRWSPIELVTSHPGAGAPAIFVGPTCFEEDVLGEWICEPPRIGDRFIVRNVSGYAVGWNTSFGGIPPAKLTFA
jgi:diaminopimelate decarboxylase